VTPPLFLLCVLLAVALLAAGRAIWRDFVGLADAFATPSHNADEQTYADVSVFQCVSDQCVTEKRSLPRARWHVRPLFAWFDFYCGLFYDRKAQALYVFFVPMLGVKIWKDINS
jgi:hypothetical protein